MKKRKGGVIIHILGEIFKNKRIEMNLTIKSLSELTNISMTEISNLERGNIKEPNSVFLYRMSNILNLDYNEVIKYRFENYYRNKELIGAE